LVCHPERSRRARLRASLRSRRTPALVGRQGTANGNFYRLGRNTPAHLIPSTWQRGFFAHIPFGWRSASALQYRLLMICHSERARPELARGVRPKDLCVWPRQWRGGRTARAAVGTALRGWRLLGVGRSSCQRAVVSWQWWNCALRNVVVTVMLSEGRMPESKHRGTCRSRWAADGNLCRLI